MAETFGAETYGAATYGGSSTADTPAAFAQLSTPVGGNRYHPPETRKPLDRRPPRWL